jgi:hypothetical protein
VNHFSGSKKIILFLIGVSLATLSSSKLAWARPADGDGVPLQSRGVATTIGGTAAMERFMGQLMHNLPWMADVPAPLRVAGPITDLPKTRAGVPQFDLKKKEFVPLLHLALESGIDSSLYHLDTNKQKLLEKTSLQPLPSADVLTAKQVLALTQFRAGTPGTSAQIKANLLSEEGKLSGADIEKIALNWKSVSLTLKPYKPLSDNQFKFLSALFLYQKNEGKCSGAIGLFNDLSKTKDFYAEGHYYMALCSTQLGLKSDFFEHAEKVIERKDVYYTKKVLSAMGNDEPSEFTSTFAEAVLKVSQNKKMVDFVDKKLIGNVYYLFTKAAMQTQQYKDAIAYSKYIPADHPKFQKAQFLQALAEYQVGSKDRAIKIEEDLVAHVSDRDIAFQAIVALDLARMQFQERKFKPAQENFLKVSKDQPLWLQSLTEMGWSQLQGGDYEGAIGNMYSVQSPFFNAIYKPESYVIRTIGYLKLCQYGDAYRTLTTLEKDYRPLLEKISAYKNGEHDLYGAVKSFIVAPKGKQDFDGLPQAVVRELAHQKDFLNLQNLLNKQIDEHDLYSKLDEGLSKELSRAQAGAAASRAKIKALQGDLLAVKTARKDADFSANQSGWKSQLESENEELASRTFMIDLYESARASMVKYRKEAVAVSDARIKNLHARMEKTVQTRLAKMKDDLSRILDNNELLRYEVFSGSGENIRFQVAGGESAHRVPASVIPQSKALQWAFEGEYWEDEIGHYRSSLKSNCPEQAKHQQASLGGSQ